MLRNGRFLLILLAIGLIGWRGGEKPRILLFYDMEGISGIDSVGYTEFKNPLYPVGQKFLTQDVNSAIRGLVAGGAGEIVVTDAHGSGNPEPDILLDEMNPGAKFEWRNAPFRPYIDSPGPDYDAIVCIGMHAGAGTKGFLAHTYTIEPLWKINGETFNETMIIAQSASRFDIPVIMVSGDDILGDRIQAVFPHAEYALVKEAASISSAILLPSEEVSNRIEKAAEVAVHRLKRGVFKPWSLPGPYRWEISFQNDTQARWASIFPGVTRVNNITVAFDSDDWVKGYLLVTEKLIPIASRERLLLLRQIVQAAPNGDALMKSFNSELMQRWFRGYPPAGPIPQPEPRPRYQGVP